MENKGIYYICSIHFSCKEITEHLKSTHKFYIYNGESMKVAEITSDVIFFFLANAMSQHKGT